MNFFRKLFGIAAPVVESEAIRLATFYLPALQDRRVTYWLSLAVNDALDNPQGADGKEKPLRTWLYQLQRDHAAIYEAFLLWIGKVP